MHFAFTHFTFQLLIFLAGSMNIYCYINIYAFNASLSLQARYRIWQFLLNLQIMMKKIIIDLVAIYICAFIIHSSDSYL